MISVEEAKSILARHVKTLADERLPVGLTTGRVISKDAHALTDVPPFSNSAMDGYAFLYKEGLTKYRVTSDIPAGYGTLRTVMPGEACRIFTGAPVPEGADTVIPQELVNVSGDEISFDSQSIRQGANIRVRGAQCISGESIVSAGKRVTPGMISLLLSAGLSHVDVFRMPKVKMIVTGSELVDPGTPLRHGEIYNSNGAAIVSYLKMSGVENIDAYQVRDDYDALRELISASLRDADALILSGGISVGDHDHVHKALMAEGVEPLFYKIRQKPGKPMFAGMKGKKMVFALPGNPASVLACFNQYVKPCLLGMAGIKDTFEPFARLPLSHDWEKKGALTHILKAVVSGGRVTILPGQESFNLAPFSDANAFVLLQEEETLIREGHTVPVYFW